MAFLLNGPDVVNNPGMASSGRGSENARLPDKAKAPSRNQDGTHRVVMLSGASSEGGLNVSMVTSDKVGINGRGK